MKDYRVRLHRKTKEKLLGMLRRSTPSRVATRIRILLNLNAKYSVEETAERVGCGTATVKRVRRKYLADGWRVAIVEAPRTGRPKKMADRDERQLIALACSDPPNGAARWTTRLLAAHFEMGVSEATVRRVLKEDGLKPWLEKNVVRSNSE